MPKLPLDPARLRELRDLRGPALRALRHPRRTVTQAVGGAVTVVGTLLTRRPAEEPVPGAVSETPAPPPTDLATGPDETVGAEETAAAPPTAESGPGPTAPPTAESRPGPTAEPAAQPTAEPTTGSDASTEDDEPPEEHLGGPAPHIPPHIAKDVERDFDEDIPGITPGRRR